MQNVKQAVQYSLILLALSAAAVFAVLYASQIDPKTVASLYGYILIPALAAIIMRYASREKLNRKTFKLGGFRNLALAWTMGVGMAVLTFVLPILFGFGKFDPTYTKFKEMITQIGSVVPENMPQFFIFMFILSLTIFLLPAVILALGEEFGFRGYLLPKLIPLGRYKALIISGSIWGLWRIPLNYLTGNLSLFDTGMMVFSSVLFGSVLGWLYFRSQSIWAPSVASAAYQSSQVLYALITAISPLVINISGTAVLLIFVLILLASGEFKAVSPGKSL